MQFTDSTFIIFFLPISLLIYYLTPAKIRIYILIGISIVFYYFINIKYLIGGVILTIVNVILSLLLEKKLTGLIQKGILLLGITINLTLLVVFKYISGSILPIGISFYTFKAISLLVDSYKNKSKNTNILERVIFLIIFAQVQSGPITRVSDFNRKKRSAYEMRNLFCEGVERFILGFCKKVLLANTLVNITNEIFTYGTPSCTYAWLGSICYSLQLFIDFSSYSDMAIGISNMLGFSCEENFNYPYSSKTVSEFWRRWHISLGAWFRDYIYIPLGGSKVNKIYIVRNLFVVWILTGIWHGDTLGFIFWGMAYFVIISVEKIFNVVEKLKSRLFSILYRIISLLMVNILWVFFYYGNIASGLKFVRNMIIPNGDIISVKRAIFLLNDYSFFIVCAILVSLPFNLWLKSIFEKKQLLNIIYNSCYVIFLTISFVISLSSVVSGNTNPFLYIGF